MKKEMRRVPLDKQFINGKGGNTKRPSDMLYGYLQMISTTDGDNVKNKQVEKRFIYKKDYKHKDVVEYFGSDLCGNILFPLKDVQRSFKLLKELGLVKENRILCLRGNNAKIFELPYNENGSDFPYKLIPLDTLIYLLDGCNHNVIKLYAFLLKGWEYYKTSFEFTDKYLLKEVFGYSSNTNERVNKQLHNRLDILKKIGLVDFYKSYKKLDNGHFIPIYKLKGVNYYIEKAD